MNKLLCFISIVMLLFSCSPSKQEVKNIDASAFEATISGKETRLITLTNHQGATVEITNYGARVVSLWVPDRDGNFVDVIWGHGSITDYVNTPVRYANPIIGRCANRINKGQFTLNDSSYQLSVNNGGHHLHGGDDSFEAHVWDIVILKENAVKLSYQSPAGESGYPGNVTFSVVYTLSEDNALSLDYTATTDAPTILNPTSHVMFNLTGNTANDVLSYKFVTSASRFLEMDATMIPTGQILNVEHTPLDFRNSSVIGDRIDQEYPLLQNALGFDHYFIFDENVDSKAIKAQVWCPENGIQLNFYTDQPGMQFYTGNFFSGNVMGKRQNPNNYRSVFALEAQGYPDAINHAHFPTIVLRPGEVYTQHTVYDFCVVE